MAEYEALAPLCMFVGRSHLGPLPRPSGAMLTPGGGVPTLESLLYHISVSHQRVTSALGGWARSVWDACRKEAFLCRAVVGPGDKCMI